MRFWLVCIHWPAICCCCSTEDSKLNYHYDLRAVFKAGKYACMLASGQAFLECSWECASWLVIFHCSTVRVGGKINHWLLIITATTFQLCHCALSSFIPNWPGVFLYLVMLSSQLNTYVVVCHYRTKSLSGSTTGVMLGRSSKGAYFGLDPMSAILWAHRTHCWVLRKSVCGQVRWGCTMCSE